MQLQLWDSGRCGMYLSASGFTGALIGWWTTSHAVCTLILSMQLNWCRISMANWNVARTTRIPWVYWLCMWIAWPVYCIHGGGRRHVHCILFTTGPAWRHYITILLADWSIIFPVYTVEKCYVESVYTSNYSQGVHILPGLNFTFNISTACIVLTQDCLMCAQESRFLCSWLQ